MNNNIENLIQRVRQGETSAFTEVYQATYKRIYFLCIGLMKNEEEAKDALQETYLSAYQHLNQLTEDKKFRSWLEQIAANTCKNMLKKKIPVPIEDDELEKVLSEESELSLSEEFILNREKRQIIMQILKEQLTDLQYQTVLLYYFDELSVREVATIMECSEAAVKNRLNAARSKIKSGVEQYETQHQDKLYSLNTLPFLTALLAEEAKRIAAPDLGNVILKEIIKQAAIGGHMLNLKLIAGISAAVIATGGAGIALYVRQQEAEETEFIEETTPLTTEEESTSTEEPTILVTEDTLPVESETFTLIQEETEASADFVELSSNVQQYTLNMFSFATDLTLLYSPSDFLLSYGFYLTEDNRDDAWFQAFLVDISESTAADSVELSMKSFRMNFTELTTSERTVNDLTVWQINGRSTEDPSRYMSNVFIDGGMESMLQFSVVYPEEYTDIADSVTEKILQTVQCNAEYTGKVYTCPYFSAAEYGDWHMGYSDDRMVIFNNTTDGYAVCFDADDSEGHLSPEVTAVQTLVDYQFSDFTVLKDEPSEFRGYEAYYQLFDSGFMYYEYTYFEVNGILYTVSELMRPEEYEFYHASAEKVIELFTIITE